MTEATNTEAIQLEADEKAHAYSLDVANAIFEDSQGSDDIVSDTRKGLVDNLTPTQLVGLAIWAGATADQAHAADNVQNAGRVASHLFTNKRMAAEELTRIGSDFEGKPVRSEVAKALLKDRMRMDSAFRVDGLFAQRIDPSQVYAVPVTVDLLDADDSAGDIQQMQEDKAMADAVKFSGVILDDGSMVLAKAERGADTYQNDAGETFRVWDVVEYMPIRSVLHGRRVIEKIRSGWKVEDAAWAEGTLAGLDANTTANLTQELLDS